MNQQLPALKPREVIRALERAGVVVSRTSGSHCRPSPVTVYMKTERDAALPRFRVA
jgi:predicted RNA binding protein YcfA (HicA-like mRNA interferase family)